MDEERFFDVFAEEVSLLGVAGIDFMFLDDRGYTCTGYNLFEGGCVGGGDRVGWFVSLSSGIRWEWLCDECWCRFVEDWEENVDKLFKRL